MFHRNYIKLIIMCLVLASACVVVLHYPVIFTIIHKVDSVYLVDIRDIETFHTSFFLTLQLMDTGVGE